MRKGLIEYPRVTTIRYLEGRLAGGYGATGKPLSARHRRDMERTIAKLKAEETAESSPNAGREGGAT